MSLSAREMKGVSLTFLVVSTSTRPALCLSEAIEVMDGRSLMTLVLEVVSEAVAYALA